jgi:predicted small metal-binding protein
MQHHRRRCEMAKELRCGDVGFFDCDGVIHADTEEDLLAQVAEHAKSVHDLTDITPEILEKVRAAIRDV